MSTTSTTFTLEATRQWIEGFGQVHQYPVGSTRQAVELARNDGTKLTVHWLTPAGQEKSDSVILFLHGGGFIGGSLVSHGPAATLLAQKAETRALFVEYRLGPENPSPACVDDVITAYRWLLEDQRIAPEKVVFAGDSAGGGLTLLTLFALHDGEKSVLPTPRAAVTLSPWTDLSCDRDSVTRNQGTDPVLSPEFALWVAYQATGAKDRAALKSPKVSAAFASDQALAKLPPLYMSAGGAEILLDDTVDLARRATEAGANVKLAVVPNMAHVFPLLYHHIGKGPKERDPLCEQELDNIAAWVKEQLRA